MKLLKLPTLIGLTFIFLLFFSCRKIENLVGKQTAREEYLHSLEKAGLADQEPVIQWIHKFDRALKNPIPIEIPYSEQLIYPVGDTRADAFLVNLPAGREIKLEVNRKEGRGELFVEARNSRDTEDLISSLDSSGMQIDAEDEPRNLVIIFQAELMAYGKWDILISHHPSLAFPVEGKDDSSVGSVFGDPRDGGSRDHHGIDVFAAKGTPVLAVDDGWIYRTGQSNLGGNVVWLNSSAGSIYYAHLDSIAVEAPKKVDIGDTLGFVGNTGNARYTPPHLHFGIYNNGPINPFPYVRQAKYPSTAGNYEPETARLSVISNTNFRKEPKIADNIVEQLKTDTEVFVLGKTGEWLRVWSNGKIGFVHFSLVKAVEVGELNVQFHL